MSKVSVKLWSQFHEDSSCVSEESPLITVVIYGHMIFETPYLVKYYIKKTTKYHRALQNI